MPKPRKPKYCMVVVGLEIPPGSNKTDIADYVNGETRMGKGTRHPDDPIFNLDPGTVWTRAVHSDIEAVVRLMISNNIHRRQIVSALERDLIVGEAFKEMRKHC